MYINVSRLVGMSFVANMLSKIQRNSEAIRFLAKCNPRQRKAIIQHVDNSTVDALCECAMRILKRLDRGRKKMVNTSERYIRSTTTRNGPSVSERKKKKLSTHKYLPNALTDKKPMRKNKKATRHGGSARLRLEKDRPSTSQIETRTCPETKIQIGPQENAASLNKKRDVLARHVGSVV